MMVAAAKGGIPPDSCPQRSGKDARFAVVGLLGAETLLQRSFRAHPRLILGS